MSTLLKKQIDSLKCKVVSLSLLVSKTLHLAIQSVVTNDESLVQKVKDNYKVIDQMEENVEEDCLKILALYTPVATDLRFIIRVIEINTNLERIAALALNTSKKTKYLARMKNFKMPIDFKSLSKSVEIMLDESIACFVQLNVSSIKNINLYENEFEKAHDSAKVLIKNAMLSDLPNYEGYNNCLNIIRHLEEIGKLTVDFFNIGKMLELEKIEEKIDEEISDRVNNFKSKRIG